MVPYAELVLKAHPGWSIASEWETSEKVVAVVQVRKRGGPGVKTCELLERFKGQNQYSKIRRFLA